MARFECLGAGQGQSMSATQMSDSDSDDSDEEEEEKRNSGDEVSRWPMVSLTTLSADCIW